MLKVLVACEESQTVCIEFRKLGHEAYSCDIQECSGGHPEWHIMQDVLPLLDGNCIFKTCDGIEHRIDGEWDLIIAHPPCTYLTVSGNRWFNEQKYGDYAKKRKILQNEAIKFFLYFTETNCKHVAIENPVGCISTYYKKPTQIIQPYYFGDNQRKTTCLWLKNLQNLVATNIVEPEIIINEKGKKTDSAWHKYTWNLNKKDRQKVRSKTFLGIAKAMATQWSDYILNGDDQISLFDGV